MCAYFTEIVITLAQLSGGGKSVSAFTHMCPGILSKRSTVATIFFLTLCIHGIGRKHMEDRVEKTLIYKEFKLKPFLYLDAK